MSHSEKYPPFTVGQRVRCVDGFDTFNAMKAGKIYIVQNIRWNERHGRYYVGFGPGNDGWDPERFEAADQASKGGGS